MRRSSIVALLVLASSTVARAAEAKLEFEISVETRGASTTGRVTATLLRETGDEAVYSFVRAVGGATAHLARGEAHRHKQTGGITLAFPSDGGLAGRLAGEAGRRLTVDLPRVGGALAGDYAWDGSTVRETWHEQDRDEIAILSPVGYDAAGPSVRFEANVTTKDVATVTFAVDDFPIATFGGAGRHQLVRALSRPGWRRFHVRAWGRAPAGKAAPLLAEASVPFVARGLELVPEATTIPAEQLARFDARPVALDGLARIEFRAGDHLLAAATGAPWDVRLKLSQAGRRVITAVALDANGRELARAETTIVVQSLLDPPAERGPIRTVIGAEGPVRLNDRTLVMLANARRWLEENGGCSPVRATASYVVQGSYHKGVAASAGTHDGGGVMDVSVSGLDAEERRRLVRALREAGFAAWYRHPPSFAPHVHAVAIGDPDLSDSARHQVAEYFRSRDGLAGSGPDEHGGPIVKGWMARFR